MKTSELSGHPECCHLGARFVSTDMLCNPLIDNSQAPCSCRAPPHNGASWAASDMAQYHLSHHLSRSIHDQAFAVRVAVVEPCISRYSSQNKALGHWYGPPGPCVPLRGAIR